VHVRPDDWDRHWAAYASAAERNPAQTYRRRLIVDILRSFDRAAVERILDIGSGTGALAADLRAAIPTADIVGLELSREGVERARQAVRGATFVQRDLLSDAEVDPRLRDWATAAVCSEVLEHVDDPRRLLQAVVPYLGPGCRLVVTVPGGPMSAFDRAIGHRRHFTPRTLRLLLEDAGFHAQWTRRAGFPFFNLYRFVVIARGRRLTRDVHAAEDSGTPLAAVAMRVFDRLFRFNLDSAPFGWQIVALATAVRAE
jgi:SAM-dependent methyltransferase